MINLEIMNLEAVLICSFGIHHLIN